MQRGEGVVAYTVSDDSALHKNGCVIYCEKRGSPMVQTGFSLQQKYALPTEQVIELLKKAGFSAVSPVYSSNTEIDLIAKCVDANGMQIQSIHAPHGVSHLW